MPPGPKIVLFYCSLQDFGDLHLNHIFPNLTELHLRCYGNDANQNQAIINSELKNHVTHYSGKVDDSDPLTWISHFPKTTFISLEILRLVESNKM